MGLAARHHEPDGSPVPMCSWGHGTGAARSTQSPERSATGGVGPATEGCPLCEVIEPLLRRADLLSQMLWIGHARAPVERKV